MDILNVKTSSGKYTVIQKKEGGLKALRYGEEWRELTGDNLVLHLAQDVENLRKENTKLKNKIAETLKFSKEVNILYKNDIINLLEK